MTASVEKGTARLLAMSGVTVAGKTGCVPDPQRPASYAWATAFAPAPAPAVVVTVLVECHEADETLPASIARQLLALLLNK